MTSDPATESALLMPGAATDQPDRASWRRVRIWSLYDWANQAFITVTATTFFPPYFIFIAAPAFLAAGALSSDKAALTLARDTASNVFALTVSLALFIAALISPFIGAYADITGRRKRLLLVATLAGATSASLMFFVSGGLWWLGLVLYFLAQIAINTALGLYSSLLPHLVRPADLNRASSLGYAMGYVGGGILLLVFTILYAVAIPLGIDRTLVIRLSFLSVGIWWIVFSIPLALHVPEPTATPLANGAKSPWHDTFVRLSNTLKSIRRYRQLAIMLAAFWLFMEGVGAIILLATAYGAALGLDTLALTGTLLMTQFVAYPYSLAVGRIPDANNRWRGAYLFVLMWTALTLPILGLWARAHPTFPTLSILILILADQVVGILLSLALGRVLLSPLVCRLDAKRTVLLGLAIYCIIPIWGFYLKSPAEFLIIGWLVGTVQGGVQALSRSIYAQLSPRAKSGEFFGLYGLAEKFAGILGPLLYGLIGQITHNPRSSVLSVGAFFIAGMLVLAKVDVEAGAHEALIEEAQIEAAHAAD